MEELKNGRRLDRRRAIEIGLQVAIYVGAYLAYLLARGLAAGGTPEAVAHAHDVLRIESTLHIDIEHWLQSTLDREPVIGLLNRVYLVCQFVVVPAALIVTFRRSKDVYRRFRNTLLAAWLIAVPIYALFPTAPPRLAGIGVIDTITGETGVKLGSETVNAFVNPYAAVPSLHVGFAFAVSIALAAIARRRATRALALTWGPLVALATFVTGNHFVLDAIAGLAVMAVAYAVALRLERRSPRPALTPLSPSKLPLTTK
jgi:membrane-associated phospholipid phosphatase